MKQGGYCMMPSDPDYRKNCANCGHFGWQHFDGLLKPYCLVEGVRCPCQGFMSPVVVDKSIQTLLAEAKGAALTPPASAEAAPPAAEAPPPVEASLMPGIASKCCKCLDHEHTWVCVQPLKEVDKRAAWLCSVCGLLGPSVLPTTASEAFSAGVEIHKLRARVDELLVSNNRYQEEAREARRQKAVVEEINRALASARVQEPDAKTDVLRFTFDDLACFQNLLGNHLHGPWEPSELKASRALLDKVAHAAEELKKNSYIPCGVWL